MLKAWLWLWLEDILRHNKPYRPNGGIPLRRCTHSLLTSRAFSLRFFSFVLETGKNPENPGCFLGMKIFWNVGNFWKTGIYEFSVSSVTPLSSGATLPSVCLAYITCCALTGPNCLWDPPPPQFTPSAVMFNLHCTLSIGYKFRFQPTTGHLSCLLIQMATWWLHPHLFDCCACSKWRPVDHCISLAALMCQHVLPRQLCNLIFQQISVLAGWKWKQSTLRGKVHSSCYSTLCKVTDVLQQYTAFRPDLICTKAKKNLLASANSWLLWVR